MKVLFLLTQVKNFSLKKLALTPEVSQKMKISKFLINNASFEVNLALKDNSVIKNEVFKIPFMIKENKMVGRLQD